MNNDEESGVVLPKEKEIIDPEEKALLKSFDYLGDIKQKRKDILNKSLDLLGKKNTSKNLDNLRKVLDRLKDNEYVINYQRGRYERNPAFNFEYVGVPLPKEKEISTISPDKTQESGVEEASQDNHSKIILPNISLEFRQAHTSDLKDAIKNWIDNFPLPSGVLEDHSFNFMVDQCEKHPLYHDLSNHLPHSGYDVCGRWSQYKNEIVEFNAAKKVLLSALNDFVSDIFSGVELNFVEYIDLTEYYVPDKAIFKDYDCSIPRLMFDYLLYELNIDFSILEASKTDVDYENIERSLMINYDVWVIREDRIKNLPILERDNSVIWGEDENMKLIRLPKEHANSLIQGKEKVLSFFSGDRDSTISKSNKYILEGFDFLIQERDKIIKELEKSLYCMSFLGDCRYLGGDPGKSQ